MAGERILLVEESAAVQELVEKTLVGEGYAVTRAHNGVAALSAPADRRPDLIMVNSRLRDVGGPETARRLRKEAKTADTPVLLLVPEEDVSRNENVDLHGATGYLKMPCDSKYIVAKTRILLDEYKARREAESHLRQVAREHLEGLVDAVIRQQLEGKVQQMLDDLSGGLVELLDVKAKEGLGARIEELAREEGKKALDRTVRDTTEQMLNEVAQEVVSRVVSELVEEKIDATVGRFEKEDLPELAARTVETHVKQNADHVLDSAFQATKEAVQSALLTEMSRVVESIAAKSVPRYLQDKVYPALENQAREMTRAALQRETRDVVVREAKDAVAPVAKELRGRITLYGMVLFVVIAAMGALSFMALGN